MNPLHHDSARALRRLPLLDEEPAQITSILKRTAGLPREPAPPTPRARRVRAFVAAAAAIAVAAAGAWMANQAPAETMLTERELAQLDADVELALVHIGRAWHETERLATIEVFGARTNPNDRDLSIEGATP